MVIGATLESVSAHSMYRTFNIKPFAQASTTTYSNGYGSSVTVTFNDNDYNFGAHTVKGTLYWQRKRALNVVNPKSRTKIQCLLKGLIPNL